MTLQASAFDGVTASRKEVSWPWDFWGVLSIGLMYGLIYSTMRMAISANLPQDDVSANVLAQTFQLGYVERQPPLYEWLLWSVQNFTGPVRVE